MKSPVPAAVRWATGAFLVVILGISLIPIAGQPLNPMRLCVVCGHQGTAAGVILNVALYAPFGAYLYLRSGSLRIALLGGVLLSMSIELIQLQIPGRYSTLEDVLANSFGAGLGGALAAKPSIWVAPVGRTGRTVALIWAGVATLVAALPGLLFTPALPDGEMYFGWTPVIPSLETYHGRGLTATIGGTEMRTGLVADDDAVRSALSDGGGVNVTFAVGPPPPYYAPVLEIVIGDYGEGEEAFQMGVDRDDLIVRFRYRADQLRLERPEFRLVGAMAGAAEGSVVAVEVTRAPGGGHEITLDGDDTFAVGLTAGRGWSLLQWPRSLPETLKGWTDLVWLAGVLLLLGWWAPSVAYLASAVAPIAALAVVPVWTPLVPTRVDEYLAAVIGLLAGYTLRSVAASARFKGPLERF